MTSVAPEEMDRRGEAKIDQAIRLVLTDSARTCAQLSRYLGWKDRSLTGAARVEMNVSHGEGTARGETDLLVRLADGATVLIEDKFSADFTPRQGERYSQRVRSLRESGEQKVASVLCAPQGHLDTVAGSPNGRAFDFRLSIETWIKWIERYDDPTAAEARALRLFREVATDWSTRAFQAVKGSWPLIHRSLHATFADRDDGWYVAANSGDWTHIHHESCRTTKFHYRSNTRQVSLELRRHGALLPAEAQADAVARGWSLGKPPRVVRMPVAVSMTLPEHEPSPQDLATIRDSLNVLLEWARKWKVDY